MEKETSWNSKLKKIPLKHKIPFLLRTIKEITTEYSNAIALQEKRNKSLHIALLQTYLREIQKIVFHTNQDG
jgi:hypothetical protein